MDALCCRAFTMQNAMQSEKDAVRVAPSVRRSVRPSGVLRVRHVYDRFARDDAEVAEELTEIEDLVFDPRSGGVCQGTQH